MKKPGIPAITTGDPRLNQALLAIKENLEIMTGARPGVREIDQLASTADLATVIAKVNEVIQRLNFTGN